MRTLFWGWVRTAAEQRDAGALELARTQTADVLAIADARAGDAAVRGG